MIKKIMKKYILKALLISLFITLPIQAYALSYKVIAIVNDESISSIQLRDRVKIIMNSTGMKNTTENRKKVAIEAYDILINEILQAQEAKSKGVNLDESIMEAAVVDLEKRNKIPPGGFKKFIESKGLSYQATLDQIKAGLLWRKTMSNLFRSEVNVTEEDIKEQALEYSDKDVKRTVNLSEIVIPIDYDKEDETYKKAMDISKRANNGEDFSELAKRYSAGKTGKKGGSVGWMEEPAIVYPLNEEVARLKSGEVGEPIRVEEMYVILKLNERKIFDPANDKQALKEKALMEKMETKAKRYIKGLRQKAFIEKRYKNSELINMIE